MTNFYFVDRDGNTPLDLDQVEGLKFNHITTMGELDELEDLNIQEGLDWLIGQRKSDFMNTKFLCKLHEKLFGNVWSWAGKFRKQEVNLSNTRPYNIGPELMNLFEDSKLWISSGRMDWNEISAELHHRLVRIHPFPNGNGRTTRIFTEHVQKKHGQQVSSWMSSISDSKLRRATYIRALKKADTGDYGPLIGFMKEKRSL